MKKMLVAMALLVTASFVVIGSEPQSAKETAVRSTPAYGMLVMRKVAVEADLADLTNKLTATHPSVINKRFELRAINREMKKLVAVENASETRLSGTVGNLILQRVALEVQINYLASHVTFKHPDLKKLRVELTALNREIQNILS